MILFKDLRLGRYEKKICGLEYLWDGVGEKILGESEFINGVLKTNGLYKSHKVSKD